MEQSTGLWKFRFAEPADAEAFSRWAGMNPQVDEADLQAALRDKNPTVLFFAAEKDGVVQAFAPIYLQAVLPHLGFNPDTPDKDKLRSLQVLIDGVSALVVQYGVREIVTMSKPEYPIARWAVKHGFEVDERQQYKLDLNKEMEVVEV